MDVTQMGHKNWLVNSANKNISTSPSKEKDLYCPKCKEIRRVKITAASAGVDTHFICQTCLKESRVTKAPAETRPTGTKSRAVAQSTLDRLAAEKAVVEIEDFNKMAKLFKGEAKAYTVGMPLEEGDAINHKVFGLGFSLEKISANKMRVLFGGGSKLMIMR